MDELIDLMSDLSPAYDGRQAEELRMRLDDLQSRARSQDASGETIAAIQGARVLLDLTALPPLPSTCALSSAI
ncbi:hypothetical protein MKK88_02650 [Methylobacterium sp. E-005]|uniref:hypothetical protein n=1 Tax=Methylobacterium sp. E-005 TaxID=2836549 RepID=UPI001FBAF638|nr:hypothetical protein [Methylobacterium sp. E-005]MCJ2084894.1 hypothetical protein [Methylobacterium sp. E-005]